MSNFRKVLTKKAASNQPCLDYQQRCSREDSLQYHKIKYTICILVNVKFLQSHCHSNSKGSEFASFILLKLDIEEPYSCNKIMSYSR